MPKRTRVGTGGIVFHVMNRAIRGTTLFESADDYSAFERILAESVTWSGVRLLAYCLMPNHWHLVVWPAHDEQLPRFLHRLTMTHAIRWSTARGTRGRGAVYQSRYRSVPVETSTHFLTVCRYVERNALRANLVARAEHWQWSSLWQRCSSCDAIPLGRWPILPPSSWVEIVNRPHTESELAALRGAFHRGTPLGSEKWGAEIADRLGLQHSRRPSGRPRTNNTGCGF